MKEDLKIIIVIGKVIENDIKARIKRAGLDDVIVKYVKFPDLDTEKDVVFELKIEILQNIDKMLRIRSFSPCERRSIII